VLPCLAKPGRAGPRPACRASPSRALPRRASPRLPCLALPGLAGPCRAMPAAPAVPAVPCLAVPGRAAPCHACPAAPGRAGPRLACHAGRFLAPACHASPSLQCHFRDSRMRLINSTLRAIKKMNIGVSIETTTKANATSKSSEFINLRCGRCPSPCQPSFWKMGDPRRPRLAHRPD